MGIQYNYKIYISYKSEGDKQMKDVKEMTTNERTLRSIIIDFRNELIGGTENHWYDCPDEFETGKDYDPHKLTKDWAINTIYSWVMNGNDKYLQSSIRNIVIEHKHIKFMGSQFVRDLITDRVEHDYQKHGWDFPNNYSGDLQ